MFLTLFGDDIVFRTLFLSLSETSTSVSDTVLVQISVMFTVAVLDESHFVSPILGFLATGVDFTIEALRKVMRTVCLSVLSSNAIV